MDDPSHFVPPKELLFVGEGADFIADGQNQLDILTRVGGLQPHHRVLDVGCGVGRVAVPLTRFLGTRGSYEGMDIVDVGIDWCQQRITPQFPKFRFQLADVFSRGYNPGGRYEASEYRFPYASGEFDFVFLYSVFTHMVPADLENYLAEIARVMKVGGRCLITYFLRNEETDRLRDAGRTMYEFRHPRFGCWVQNPAVPEEAICYAEPDVLSLYEKYGFAIDGSIHYGTWAGRPSGVNGQDVIVATKVRNVQANPRSPWPVVRWLRRIGRLPQRLLGWRGDTRNVVRRAKRYGRAA
jgi:SAM-dependent methyltransferase